MSHAVKKWVTFGKIKKITLDFDKIHVGKQANANPIICNLIKLMIAQAKKLNSPSLENMY